MATLPNSLPTWTTHELQAWRPPSTLSVSEWADEHRRLDIRFSSEPGRFRTGRTPYTREWMDSALDPWVHRVTICASTQVGKTETLNNLVGWMVTQRPAPMLMVMPRRVDAQLLGEKRIRPMLDSCDALQSELTGAKHDMRKREMTFRRCTLYFRAAQSPADLASTPARVVLGDEADKWPRWTGREASPWDLVVERTRTYLDRFLVLTSTPTTREGLIWTEFEAGDQRRYHVPCPRCGKFQVLKFHRIDTQGFKTAREMRRARTATYACEHCEAQLPDREKMGMLQRGMWVPEGKTAEQWQRERVKDREPHRSYHIWAAYSPWLTWSDIAAQFLDSKDTPGKLMNFCNSWLAEVWEERVDSARDDAITACAGNHNTGECPTDVLVLTAAVDVQKDWLAWMICGWGLDEESWVIENGNCTTWEQLDAALFKRTFGAKKLSLRIVFVDSRYRRTEVMDFVRRRPTCRMIAGTEREAPIPFHAVKLDKHPRTGAPLPFTMTVWTITVAWFKDLCAARLSRALESSAGREQRIWLPADLSDEAAEELGSEHKIRVRSRGKEKLLWVKKAGRERNEAWDLLVYNAAAARLIHCETLTSKAPPRAGPSQPPPRSPRPPVDPGPFGRNPVR